MHRTARSIPILTYHQIADAPLRGAPYRSLYVAPDVFSRQMATLKALGYQGLSMSALLPYLHGERTGKVVGITFDDGYCNNLEHAMPVLERHGFSSTCYIVSTLIGRTNVWDAANGVAQTPLMNAAQLREWCAGGQELGAHTRTHADLTLLDKDASRAEVELCKAEIEAIAQQPVQHFCYPYGAYGKHQVLQVLEAGYLTATTTLRGRAVPGSSLLELARVPVVRSTLLPVFMLKVATGYEDRTRG